MFKKKYLLLILFSIIIFQTILYTTNKQRASFRYFKWTAQEVSIGKLISISFFTGLFISTMLNNTLTSYKNNNLENSEENDKPLNNKEEMITNIEMPPQRDIRDNQPTISVNYRVVKNMDDNNRKKNQNLSNDPDNKDDWDNYENEW